MRRKLAVLAMPAVALAACGTTEIDAGKTESLIKDNIVGPKPKSVDCPDGVEAKKGATFTCDVVYAQSLPQAVVTIHIVDEEGRIRFGPGDFRKKE